MAPSVRYTAFVTVILSVWPLAAQEKPEEIDGLEFREPFSGLSASEIESKRIVFLITDEDPFEWTKAKLDKADKNRLGGGPDVWCGADFRRSFVKLLSARPDLKDRCIAQRVVAGLPGNLTGDAPRTLPSRAIVAICDGQYRLLNFSVGVPEPDDLLHLIEDAEENKSLLELHEGSPAKIGEAILARTNNRVRRIYRESLARLSEQMNWDESIQMVDDAWISKYARFVSELQPSYLFDVKLRFALSDTSDLVRLMVLEQHCETRKDWCDSLAPYVVGRPMRELINPLVDTTWGVPAVVDIADTSHEEPLRWFSSRRDNSTIVLAIKPNYLDRDLVWPPPDIKRASANRGWTALETAMSKHAYRSVTAEELAVILRENQELSIDLLVPARARYVIFEPGKKKLFVVRESDVPGRFISRLETK